jgi:hypothetical protein
MSYLSGLHTVCLQQDMIQLHVLVQLLSLVALHGYCFSLLCAFCSHCMLTWVWTCCLLVYAGL